MKRIRGFFAAMALVATLLSGPILQSTGLASLANATASRHPTAASVVGHSAKPEAYKPNWPCPTAGSDC